MGWSNSIKDDAKILGQHKNLTGCATFLARIQPQRRKLASVPKALRAYSPAELSDAGVTLPLY
jgi:hypothetical protein